MNIINTFLITIIMVLFAVILISISYFLNKIKDIRNEYDKKIEDYDDSINTLHETVSESLTTIQDNIPTLNIHERLQYNEELLEFIDMMITNEFIHKKRFEIFLNEQSKNLDIDKVIQEVSSNVFSCIKPEIFINPNNIVTEKYLLHYIQERTFIISFSYIKEKIVNRN